MDKKLIDTQPYTLLGGISIKKGLEHFILKKNSINSTTFAQFLEELRKKNIGCKLAVFLDNLNVHHSRISMASYAGQQIDPIFNIPYQP